MNWMSKLFAKQLPPEGLRTATKNKWCVYEERVGILVPPNKTKDPAALPEFHVTNEVGETTLVVANPNLNKVRLATLKEIPEPRRPTRERGARLGYL